MPTTIQNVQKNKVINQIFVAPACSRRMIDNHETDGTVVSSSIEETPETMQNARNEGDSNQEIAPRMDKADLSIPTAAKHVDPSNAPACESSPSPISENEDNNDKQISKVFSVSSLVSPTKSNTVQAKPKKQILSQESSVSILPASPQQAKIVRKIIPPPALPPPILKPQMNEGREQLQQLSQPIQNFQTIPLPSIQNFHAYSNYQPTSFQNVVFQQASPYQYYPSPQMGMPHSPILQMAMQAQPNIIPMPMQQNASRASIPRPVVTVPSTHVHNMQVPKPFLYKDTNSGEIGLRCVCGKNNINETLVRCEMCDFFLHAMCVNVPREVNGEPFFCPYCLRRRIVCKCGDNSKYTEPIIQCTVCKLWVHKSCEGLEFGRIPDNFVCSQCGSPSEYKLKYVHFDQDDVEVIDKTSFIECNRVQLLMNIPDGNFRMMISCDLEKSQLNFREIVAKYFHTFAYLLFDRAHEFWKVFVESLSILLETERSDLLTAIDVLTTKLLYSNGPSRPIRPFSNFEHSEAITRYIETLSMPRLEKIPQDVNLYIGTDNHVHTPVALDDGAFITDLPGFLCHEDEVKADNGIPLTCMLVTDDEVVIDMEGSKFVLAPRIRRSFHFNCIVKLIRVNGDIKVALYATRTKGPLSEEKSRRGPAIPENGELFLPFDGDIPYPICKYEWKQKKTRNRTAPPPPKPKPPKPIPNGRKTRKSGNISRKDSQEFVPKKPEIDYSLTLLSSFMDDAVPPMPFILLSDRKAVEKYKSQMEIKARTRHKNGE